MPFGEVDSVSEFDHAAQEVGPRSKTFDDAGNLLPSRTGSPKIISRGSFSGSFVIFDDLYFGGRFRDSGGVCAFMFPCTTLFIIRHRLSFVSNSRGVCAPYRTNQVTLTTTIQRGNKLTG
jgi:hypothetical protein